MKRIKKYTGIYYNESKKKRHKGKPDNCFYAVYQDKAGKNKWEKIGWASEGYNAQMADQVRSERIRSLRHGKELPDKKKKELTFGQAWKEYDKWLDTGKKHVYDDRNRYQNHIKTRFASRALSQISTHDLERFKDTLLRNGLAPATTKHVLVIIRQVYNKMIAWGLWQGQNPITGLKMPKINNKRVRFFTHKEADKLLAAVKVRSQQIWEMSLLSLHTGMRADEVFSLLWGHIDYDNGLIHIADPKGGPARDGNMTKKVRAMLSAKSQGERGELVFKARHGGKIPEVSKSFLRTVNDLKFNDGIEDRRQKASFHTLRHTFASWLAIQGTPILVIKELMGHASLAMTERYAHLIPDQKKESVERMEEAFEEGINGKDGSGADDDSKESD